MSHSALLGPDLTELLSSREHHVADVESLTTLRSDRMDRGAFRLVLRDGQQMKGRIVRTTREAERIQALATLLDPKHFPKVLARHGRALLIAWAQGTPATAGQLKAEFFERCGEILGGLHSRVVPDEYRARFGFKGGDWTGRAKTCVERLAALGVLSSAEAATACSLIAQPPNSRRPSLMHGDFCLENIVIDDDGRLWVVDNENITVDSPDYDALRTWYRWPMSPEQAEPFLRGYRRQAGELTLFDDRYFWAVAAFSEAAAFRIEGETGGEERLVDLLKRAIRGDLSLDPWT